MTGTPRLTAWIAGCVLGAFATAAGAQFNLNLNRIFDTVKNAGTAATESLTSPSHGLVRIIQRKNGSPTKPATA